MTAEFKISLAPVSDELAVGAAREILENTQSQLGFVPTMYRAMANSPGFLSTYAHGYTAFRQNSGFSAQEQETVFLVISRENGCDYCTAAHSMVAEHISKLDAPLIEALRTGAPLADTKLQALAVFTARVFASRGMITKAEAAAFLSAGFSEKQILDVVLAVAVKTLSNYSNHIFHNDLDEAFAPYRVTAELEQVVALADE